MDGGQKTDGPYLLENRGYDSDLNIKRLGDGLYEQRLIQQAVVARTGQRYIDGQTSDEGLFRYLMTTQSPARMSSTCPSASHSLSNKSRR